MPALGRNASAELRRVAIAYFFDPNAE